MSLLKARTCYYIIIFLVPYVASRHLMNELMNERIVSKTKIMILGNEWMAFLRVIVTYHLNLKGNKSIFYFAVPVHPWLLHHIGGYIRYQESLLVVVPQFNASKICCSSDCSSSFQLFTQNGIWVICNISLCVQTKLIHQTTSFSIPPNLKI